MLLQSESFAQYYKRGGHTVSLLSRFYERQGDTHHNDGDPGLSHAGAAPRPAVEKMDALSAGGQGSRGGKGALGGKESRGGEGLEGDHVGYCWLEGKRQ